MLQASPADQDAGERQKCRVYLLVFHTAREDDGTDSATRKYVLRPCATVPTCYRAACCALRAEGGCRGHAAYDGSSPSRTPGPRGHKLAVSDRCTGYGVDCTGDFSPPLITTLPPLIAVSEPVFRPVSLKGDAVHPLSVLSRNGILQQTKKQKADRISNIAFIGGINVHATAIKTCPTTARLLLPGPDVWAP